MSIWYNNLKTTLKGFIKDRSLALLILLGMVLGFTSFILIYQVVVNELSYDRFHRKSDRIFRVISDIRFGSSIINSPATMPPLAQAIVNDIPGTELAARLLEKQGLVGYNNNFFNEKRILAVETSFLQIFDFNILKGKSNNLLKDPGSILISASTALKYFDNRDPLGEKLEITNDGKKHLFVVAGIFEDCPENSSIMFDFLLPLSAFPEVYSGNWNSLNVNTFVLLQSGNLLSSVDNSFPALVKKYIGNNRPDFDKWLASGNKFTLTLQPLNRIHLYSKFEADYAKNGNIMVIYILLAIAFLIITISAINYINLSNIRLYKCSKQTGIMRILGASNIQLTVNYVLLSVLICVVALIAAAFIVTLIMPYFQEKFGKQEIYVLAEWVHVGVILALAVAIGIISGFFPALKSFVQQKHKPLLPETVKNSNINGMRVFVTFQNVLSICLIISTIVIVKQTSLLINKHPGYKTSDMVIIKNVLPLKDKTGILRDMLLKNPDILGLTVSDYVPSQEVANYFTLHYEEDSNKYDYSMSGFSADDQFLKTYGINISEGKYADTIFGPRNACVMNYAAINQFKIKYPLGKEVWWGPNKYIISGIIPDVNYESLRFSVRPLIITPLRKNPENIFISVRCSSVNIANTLAYIRNVWEKIAGSIPLEYNFLDKNLTSLYQKEISFSELSAVSSFLAIIIACLGIFGLSTFTSIQRTKEIGIRKVNGARITEVMAMLNRDFIKWVSFAFIIACPIAWYAMHKWLENFAYKTALSWWVFAAAGAIAMLIALLTVSFQSWRAATRNPVESLRYE